MRPFKKKVLSKGDRTGHDDAPPRQLSRRCEEDDVMKAIGLISGTATLRLVDRPGPRVQAPTEAKLRGLQVGICGTDLEEGVGGRVEAPAGQGELGTGLAGEAGFRRA